MAWQTDDVQRSVRRYLMMLLVDYPSAAARAWEIRLQRGNVADQDRPIGVLEALPGAPGRGRTSVPQGTVIETSGLVFTGYPAILTGGRAIIEGGLQATRLASALYDLIRYGLSTVTFASGRRAAGPERIPLWDFSAVPIAGTAPPMVPHDILVVDAWGARALQDPVDETRYSIVLNLTVSWERPGVIGPPAPIAGSMTGTFQTSP